jgi:hypothetical protein
VTHPFGTWLILRSLSNATDYDTAVREESERFDNRKGALMGDHQHLTLLKQGSSERILNGVPRSQANHTDTGDEQWTGNRLESWL